MTSVRETTKTIKVQLPNQRSSMPYYENLQSGSNNISCFLTVQLSRTAREKGSCLGKFGWFEFGLTGMCSPPLGMLYIYSQASLKNLTQ